MLIMSYSLTGWDSQGRRTEELAGMMIWVHMRIVSGNNLVTTFWPEAKVRRKFWENNNSGS